MDEFTDIYRIYAKNYNVDVFEKGWEEEDIKLLNEKLDKVAPLIENGDLIIDILKREMVDNHDCPTFGIALENLSSALFEIEKRVKGSREQSDQNSFAAQAYGPMAEINKEIEKKEEFKPEVKPKISPRGEAYAPFEEVLHSYRNTTIYRQVYDYLLETLPDKFNYKNVYDLIDSIYREKPKRKLKNKTLETYVGRYIDYMKKNEKIEIDKESGMFVKIIKKEIIKVPEKQKSDYPKGGWKGIFPKDQILAKYGTVNIYKPIVDEIMSDENLPDEFTTKDLSNFLFNYFNHVLNKKITDRSSEVYASKYVKYLVKNKLIRLDVSEGRSPNNLFKIKEKSKITIGEIDDVEKPELANEEKQPPVDFANGDTLDEAIYNYALRSWIKTHSVPTLTIERRFPDVTTDEIGLALSKLIKEGKAFQSAPGRIKFLVVEA